MRRACIALYAGFVIVSAGCQGSSSPTPKSGASSPIVEGSAPGIAATSDPASPAATAGAPAGTSVAATAGATPVVERPVETAPAEPATFSKLVETLDFRKITIPEDGELQGRSVSTMAVSLKRDPAATAAYVREQFAKLGATEQKSDTPDTPPYVSLTFTKNDALYSVFVSPDTSREGQSSFVATNHGNLDAAKLPKIDGVTPLFAFRHSTTWIAPGDVPQTAAATREVLAKHGWREYLRAGGGPPASDTQAFLEFFQNGVHLQAFVSQAPAQGNKTTVQYNLTALEAELPLPADATDARFGPEPNTLAYHSPLKPPALGEFYQRRFAELGWAKKKDEDGKEWGVVNEQAALLVMQRDNDVTMIEAKADEAGSKVIVRGMIEKLPDDEKAAAERMEKAAAEKSSNRVELPLPPDARDVEYPDDGKRASFKSKLSVRELIEFYAKAFPAAGWKENESNRKIEATTGNFNAVQGDDDRVFVNVFKLNDETDAEVSAVAIGCLWKTGSASETPPANEKPAGGSNTLEKPE